MLTIQRVLFPTDFSDGAREAFPQAAALAHWHDAELHVMNVTGRHRHDYEDATKHFPIDDATLTDWLGPAASRALNLDDLSIVQKQVESATPPERIVAYAEDEDIDTIVMGTHGRRGVDRMLFGSVTEEVVRTAPCPVMTVRAGADEAPKQAVRRVLVPVDFSDASLAAVRHAREIALTYGAEIDLLHVVEEMTYPSAYGMEATYFPTDEIVQSVEKSLGDLVRDEIGYEHAQIAAEVGHPPTTILDYVEEQAIDLVVLATQGRTGLDRVLFGSVAERVLRGSPAPVFVVKPDTKSLLPQPVADTTEKA